MPSPIDLDLNHWVRVVPAEGRTQVVKCLGFACFYASGASPPELASEGTELAANSTVTIEPPSGKWFITKKAAATEIQKPAILEVQTAAIEDVETGDIATGAVTEAKIGALAVTEAKLGAEAVAAAKIKAEAVTSAKVLPSTLPAAGAEKTVVVGTAGVQRKITAVHVGDGVETKVKVKHSFETEAVNVVVQKGAETKKPGENYLNAAGAGNVTWKPISLSEIEATFGTAPIAKFESFLSVYG